MQRSLFIYSDTNYIAYFSILSLNVPELGSDNILNIIAHTTGAVVCILNITYLKVNTPIAEFLTITSECSIYIQAYGTTI